MRNPPRMNRRHLLGGLAATGAAGLVPPVRAAAPPLPLSVSVPPPVLGPRMNFEQAVRTEAARPNLKFALANAFPSTAPWAPPAWAAKHTVRNSSPPCEGQAALLECTVMDAQDKNRLAELIEQLPEEEIHAAVRYLEYLKDRGDPYLKFLMSVSEEDEELTDRFERELDKAWEDMDGGRVISSNQLKQELGL